MQHLILLGLPTVSGLVPSVLGNLASSQHRWSVSTRLFGFRQKDKSCHIITWVWHSLTYYIHTHTITCGYMLFSGILVRGAWWQNYIYIIDEGSWRLTDNRQSIHWAKLCRLADGMSQVAFSKLDFPGDFEVWWSLSRMVPSIMSSECCLQQQDCTALQPLWCQDEAVD